jgi:hypothetical protein
VTYSTGGAITGEYLAEQLGRQDPIQYEIFIAIISMFMLHTSKEKGFIWRHGNGTIVHRTIKKNITVTPNPNPSIKI